MRHTFLINYVSAIFGIHACVSILEHIVEPPVVSNCSSVTLTCRLDAGLPNVEVWWTFRGENALKLPDTYFITANADKGEWQLQMNCPTLEHKGAYFCNAQERNESEVVYSREAIVRIYEAPQVEFTNETTIEDPSTVTIHWRVKYDGNLPVTRFRLYRDNPVDGSTTEVDSDILGNATKYTIHALLPDFTYSFKLAAFNEAGESNFVYLNVSMPANVPSKVFWVHTLASTNETLLFGWREPNHENGVNITHYNVKFYLPNGGLYLEKTKDIFTSRKNHMYIFVGLEPGETYIFQVRACNALGCGTWSEPLQASTTDGGASM